MKSSSGWDHLRWAKTGDDPMGGTHYYYRVSSTNIHMLHEPFGWNMHSLKLTWPLKNGGEQTALSFREGKCPKVSEALTAHLLPYLFFSSPRSTSAGPAGHAGVSEI